mgnify:CR=1 FL=1
MHISQVQAIERGLDRIFQDAGANAVWFRYSGTAASLPEYGLGISVTYYTAYVRCLLAAAKPQESQLPGGAYEQGMLEIKTREVLGKDDMVELGTIRYRVEGAPQQVLLGPTLFYRLLLRRAE